MYTLHNSFLGPHQKRHTATFVQNVMIRASFYGEKVMFHHPIYVCMLMSVVVIDKGVYTLARYVNTE